MKILSKNALFLFGALAFGTLTISCDRDGDGDIDFGDKCYECSEGAASYTFCKDNYEEFLDDFNITNAADYEDFVNQVEGLPNVNCKRVSI